MGGSGESSSFVEKSKRLLLREGGGDGHLLASSATKSRFPALALRILRQLKRMLHRNVPGVAGSYLCGLLHRFNTRGHAQR